MQKIIVMCLCIMLLVGMASANTVWNPAGNSITPPDVGLWGDPNNWGSGLPGITEGLDPKAVFNLADPAECQVIGHNVCGTLVMGDNGADSPQNAVLRIMPGATLEITGTSSWTALGYNRDGGSMIIENGATVTMDSHLYIGMNDGASGRLVMNGGTLLVADTFRYGRNTGTTGFVDLNAGYFQARYLNSALPNVGSLFDIRYGKFLLTGGEDSDRDRLQALIDNGFMVGFGGKSAVDLQEAANGDWFVTADDPMDPWPFNITVPVGDVNLSWTNLDPNDPAGSVWVDVWFGTDPNKLDLVHYTQVVIEGENTITVPVSAPDNGTYYWQVDSYIWGDPTVVDYDNTFPVIEGDVWTFNATADLPPAVDAGVDMITWSNEPVQLDATVDDDGESPLTYAWSADPAEGVVFSATDVEDPTVTIAPYRAVVRGIQAGGDDAEEHINADDANGGGPPPGTMDLGSSDLELGSEGNSGLDWQVIAVQYDTLGIPQGANVTSAKITFEVDNSGEGAGERNDFTIFAEATENALPFTDDLNNITDRARSTASVSWAPAAGPPVDAKVDTPDLTSLIQEIVDQLGWSEDNRLTLMIYPNVYLEGAPSDTKVQEIEFEAGPGSDSATLTVRYELSAGYVPAPGTDTITLTLAVHDEFNTTPVEDTLTIDVYETPCYAAIGAGLTANYIADFNGDCIINLADFAAMIAPYWDDDYALTVPIPGP